MPELRTDGDKQRISITFTILSEVNFTKAELKAALRYGLQDLMQDTDVMGGVDITTTAFAELASFANVLAGDVASLPRMKTGDKNIG